MSEIELLKEDNRKLKEALEYIQNPIKKFQEDADRDGMKLDGCMAVALSKDPVFLQEIARKAIESCKHST
jgi:hypothetical protein